MSVPTTSLSNDRASSAALASNSGADSLGPWRWSQNWRDVSFAHWSIPPKSLRPHLPEPLELDLWDGLAWVSIVAFRLDVKHRWLPSFGLTSNFIELNLRTYVRLRGEPGIYFLSIHAGSPIAVTLARWLTPLPYVNAGLSYSRVADYWRLGCRAFHGRNWDPLVAVDFASSGPCVSLDGSTLDAWLLERYRAFVPDSNGGMLRMVAKHAPWIVQHAGAKIDINRLGKPWGFDLNCSPDTAHFAAHMPARIYPFETMATELDKSPI